MEQKISLALFEDKKLMSHFMENSYLVKDLNRNPNYFKNFTSQMKVLYKERPTDKLNNVVDGIEMISSLIEASK